MPRGASGSRLNQGSANRAAWSGRRSPYTPSCLELIITVSAGVPGQESDQGARPRAGFPRRLRLLRHADFEKVYELGRRHFSASMTVFYRAREAATSKNAPPKGLRVGFTVGRALGGAVERNRIKRRLREAVRLSHPPMETAADVVINPRKGFLAADFEAVVNEVRRAFVGIEEKLKGKPAMVVPQNRDFGRKPKE